MTIIELMIEVRDQYPADWTHEDRGKYLNQVAWEMQQVGFPTMGLLAKPSGNNCPSPTGTLCSCDFLVERNTMNGYDVLVNETIPFWPGFDHPSDNFAGSPERWVAPVDPGSTPPQPPEPPTMPDLEPRVAALETLFQEVLHQIGILNQQLANLTTDVNRPLEAVGRTGSALGHRHDVQVDVRRKS
jgi:hypothetical protein